MPKTYFGFEDDSNTRLEVGALANGEVEISITTNAGDQEIIYLKKAQVKKLENVLWNIHSEMEQGDSDQEEKEVPHA